MKLYKILFESEEAQDADGLDQTARMIEREIAERFDLSPTAVRLKPNSDIAVALRGKISFYGIIIAPDEQTITITFTFDYMDTTVGTTILDRQTSPVPFKPTLPDPDSTEPKLTNTEQFAKAMHNGLLANEGEWFADNVLPLVEELVYDEYYPENEQIVTVSHHIVAALGLTIKPGSHQFGNAVKMIGGGSEWYFYIQNMSINKARLSLTRVVDVGQPPAKITIDVPLKILFFEAGKDPELLDRISDTLASYVKPHLTP